MTEPVEPHVLRSPWTSVSYWHSSKSRRAIAACAWLLCGVVLPAYGFVTLFAFRPSTRSAVIAALYPIAAMLVLITYVVFRPRSKRLTRLLAGAMWGTVIYGTGFTLLLSPFLVMWFVHALGRGEWLSPTTLLAIAPGLGTFTYFVNAMEASENSRRVGKAWFLTGMLGVTGVAFSPSLVLFAAERVCIARMLSNDHASAQSAAARCECLPRDLVSWQSMVDEWIEAKGGKASNPATPRSNEIADVFQELTGHDLRRGYDDSARY